MSATRSFASRYREALWKTMDALGVTESVERKVVAALVIQFVVAISFLFLPPLFLGIDQTLALFPIELVAITAVVFGLAILALYNTIIIVQADVVQPVRQMQAAATAVADGDLDTAPPTLDQADEIGDLANSFGTMHDSLSIVARQANALGNEEFDAPVLEENVPGEFGDALEEMEANLRSRIERLETQRKEVQRQNEELTATAESYMRSLEAVADGDLTRRLDPDTDNDAMLDVADAVNEMLAEHEQVIGDLVAFADAVATETASVDAAADEVYEASENITESVNEIYADTETVNDHLETASGEISNLSATVQEITASADNVADLTDRTADTAEDGRVAAAEAVEEMHEIEEQTAATVETVDSLDEELEAIEEITDLILDVAEQTNILAINASIEAARVGNESDGFAVVAEEVKDLANRTKASAENIGDRVAAIQAESDEAVNEIKEMSESVTEGVETVEEATAAFEEMAENVADINTSIQEVRDATAQQAESTQDLVGMTEDVASVSDQTSTETGSVAAAAEEQTASIQEVRNNTRTLADDARSLANRLDEFDVREAAIADDVSTRAAAGGDERSAGDDAAGRRRSDDDGGDGVDGATAGSSLGSPGAEGGDARAVGATDGGTTADDSTDASEFDFSHAADDGARDD